MTDHKQAHSDNFVTYRNNKSLCGVPETNMAFTVQYNHNSQTSLQKMSSDFWLSEVGDWQRGN